MTSSILPSRFIWLRTIPSGAICCALLAVGSHRAAAADELAAPNCPLAAHNAYTWRLYGNQRLPRALAAGLQHIEVDVSWDSARQEIVVTHDNPPRGGEPELASFLEPLWQAWRTRAGTGYTLIIDFKSTDPACAAKLQNVLRPHANQLAALPKQGGAFCPGPITVCLTGAQAAHRHYADSLAPDDTYLAFGDTGVEGWREDVADRVPREPPGFVRFVTVERGLFLDDPKAKGNDHLSVDRMRRFMDAANARGYRVRVYTLNPTRGADGQYDTTPWDRCLEAGVHMVATDAYELARDYWNRRQTQQP